MNMIEERKVLRKEKFGQIKKGELQPPWAIPKGSAKTPWMMNGCPDYRTMDIKVATIDHILSWTRKYPENHSAGRPVISDAMVMPWQEAVKLYVELRHRDKVHVKRKDKNGITYETTTKKRMTDRQIFNHHKRMVQNYIKINQSTCVVCNRKEELRFGYCFECAGWDALDYKLPTTEDECRKAMYDDLKG